MRIRWSVLLVLAMAAGAGMMPASAQVGPYEGGPTHYFTASDGTEIALSVMLPHDFDPGRRYPAILEMAGYENGSASPSGRTMSGQTKDFLCGLDPEPQSGRCPGEDPPLADDSHGGTSAIRYRDAYVVVHASLPGTGCSSGQWDLFSIAQAKAGAEVIDRWIAQQPWSNGRVGLLGHSFSGATALLIAAHQPKHLVAMTISGMIDDNYRGLTYPGGVFNGVFPPAWYLGIRPAYDVIGGTGQGTVRNAGNDRGHTCAANLATHRRGTDNDPLLHGDAMSGTDNELWRRISMITYVDRIRVPIHITGMWQDEQTGARGASRLWEHVAPGVPKRLLQSNGDHGTNVDSVDTWGDRKAWMDYWMRGVRPHPRWDMTEPSPGGPPTVKQTSVRTLFDMQPGPDGELVAGAHHDSAGYPLDGTTFTDHYLCGGRTLETDRDRCAPGAAMYFSGSRRQSWLYQAGPAVGAPVTSNDGADQVRFTGPVVEPGRTWAMAGPITANLYLATSGEDTDLFVQVADEDTTTGELKFLQRGWLKASHRAIDQASSDRTDVDPARRGFLYRPHRPHVDPQPVEPNMAVEYLVEVWPVAHVFRPGHRLVVVVTAPPAVDSNYGYAAQRTPPTLNTIFFNDLLHPSRITLPVLPRAAVRGLDPEGPGCGDYWQVRCVS